jgi:hypothetical protein
MLKPRAHQQQRKCSKEEEKNTMLKVKKRRKYPPNANSVHFILVNEHAKSNTTYVGVGAAIPVISSLSSTGAHVQNRLVSP